VIGKGPMTRAEVTSKVWEYIKANGLQDTKDKRQINPDAKLGAVIGKDQISMFKMTAAVSKHLPARFVWLAVACGAEELVWPRSMRTGDIPYHARSQREAVGAAGDSDHANGSGQAEFHGFIQLAECGNLRVPDPPAAVQAQADHRTQLQVNGARPIIGNGVHEQLQAIESEIVATDGALQHAAGDCPVLICSVIVAAEGDPESDRDRVLLRQRATLGPGWRTAK
jgi:hypothetical protein